MVDYRCYFLSRSNSFIATVIFQSDTDSEAIVQATILAAKNRDCAGFELWHGARHVHKHVGSLPRRANRAAADDPPVPAADPLAAVRSLSARCRGNGSLVPMTLSEARRIRAAATGRPPRGDRCSY